MSSEEILYPALATIGLTFVVGILLLVSRIRSVQQGEVSIKYFVLLKGGDLPARLLQLSNNLNNLLQLPLLFYILTLFVFVANRTDSTFVYLGWIFFASRVAHSIVHNTYNNVLHRMSAFLIGFVILIVIWVRLTLALMS